MKLVAFLFVEKCCSVVAVSKEFAAQILLVQAAELALFYVIGNCCNIVVVKQEFR